MLLDRGRLRAKLAYRQVRDFPARGGQATLRVSIRSPRAEEHLQALLEKIEWHGVCQADFVIEESTQTPYLIDMNPRLWGSLAQAIASGVDFPHLIYRLALEGDVEPVTDFKTGVATRWLGGDLRAFLPHLRLAERKAAFVRDFLFPRPRPALLDDVSLADPLPFCVWAMQVVRRASGWRRSGTGQQESLAGVWK
jgi:predicted ATP-grasp superfamily ATP-dependent carboligase